MFPVHPFFKRSVWYLCHYSGLRFIWSIIHPQKEGELIKATYRKPATFPLWVIGTYVAFFGIASQRYENRVDIIETRANAIFTQLSTPFHKKAISQIPRIQRMECPVNPEILDPISVWQSLFSVNTVYPEIVDHLKETVVIWKLVLDSTDLSFSNLTGAYLMGSNLVSADLGGADLSETFLSGAELRGANLTGADLSGANLIGADLSGAHLFRANLGNADLFGANLSGANLIEANLGGASLIGADVRGAYFEKRNYGDSNEANLIIIDLSASNFIKPIYRVGKGGLIGLNYNEENLKKVDQFEFEQLCEASSLYQTLIDSVLLEQIRYKCPQLLEEPEEEVIQLGDGNEAKP